MSLRDPLRFLNRVAVLDTRKFNIRVFTYVCRGHPFSRSASPNTQA
jgi:hypothetical protein